MEGETVFARRAYTDANGKFDARLDVPCPESMNGELSILARRAGCGSVAEYVRMVLEKHIGAETTANVSETDIDLVARLYGVAPDEYRRSVLQRHVAGELRFIRSRLPGAHSAGQWDERGSKVR